MQAVYQEATGTSSEFHAHSSEVADDQRADPPRTRNSATLGDRSIFIAAMEVAEASTLHSVCETRAVPMRRPATCEVSTAQSLVRRLAARVTTALGLVRRARSRNVLPRARPMSSRSWCRLDRPHRFSRPAALRLAR